MKAYVILIMSLVLFMRLSLSINRARIENTTYMQETRSFNNAISLAQSILDGADTVAFDSLAVYAARLTQSSYAFEGDTFDVQVTTASLYTDDSGVVLTQDADLVHLQVLVTKQNSMVYVNLSQIISEV